MTDGAGRRDIAAAVLVFAGAAVFLALAMDHRLIAYDEGLILVGAMRVLDGGVIHRDFYANYGPGQFYVVAALFKLFGPSVLAERIWDVVVRSGIATAAFLVIGTAAPRGAAIAAATLVAIWLCAFGYYAYPVFPALLFVLVGVRCLAPSIDGHPTSPSLVASGVALGMAALFRYDIGAYAAAAFSAFVVLRRLADAPSWRHGVAGASRALRALWFGLAIICVSVALAFYAYGALPDFVFDIVTFSAKSYWRMRALPFPSPRALIADPEQLGVFLPIAVWLAALALAIAHRQHRPISASAWLTMLLTGLSIVFYAKGLVRVSTVHMSLSIVPAMLVAVLIYPQARVLAAQRTLASPVALAGIALFILFALSTLFAMKADARALADGVAWALRPTTWAEDTAGAPSDLATCHPPAQLRRMACFGTEPARAAAIRYIVEHTSARDFLFVGLDRHDRVFANDNIFYFLAGRRPATKWSHFDPGLQTSAPIQQQIIDDLRATKPPPYVVLDAEYSHVTEPNESRLSSGVFLLDRFLRAAYEPVATFAPFTIMKARDRGEEKPGPGVSPSP